MTYDLHGAWEKTAGLNAPLYATSEDPDPTLNVDWAAQYIVDLGCPKEKLIIGLATYGRSLKLTNPSINGINAPISGAGQQGPVGYLIFLLLKKTKKISIQPSKSK